MNLYARCYCSSLPIFCFYRLTTALFLHVFPPLTDLRPFAVLHFFSFMLARLHGQKFIFILPLELSAPLLFREGSRLEMQRICNQGNSLLFPWYQLVSTDLQSHIIWLCPQCFPIVSHCQHVVFSSCICLLCCLYLKTTTKTRKMSGRKQSVVGGLISAVHIRWVGLAGL